MGRGSNLFVRQPELAGVTIRNVDACRELSFSGTHVSVGGSVPLQGLITTCGKSNLGGIEYLHSVPGNVGGAIFMNAGRGKKHDMSIGQRVVEIEFFDGNEIRRFSQRDCRFDYRRSVFHDLPEGVILHAILELDRVPNGEVTHRLRERLDFTKETQDNNYPNAGSVFKEGWRLTKELSGVRVGGAQFSELTPNWIICVAESSARDIDRLIGIAKRRHKRRGLPIPELEWTVW